MDTNAIFQSKSFRWVLIGIGCLIVLLFVFKLGEFVGARKADFSYRWGENYHRMFGGPRGGFLQDFGGRDLLPGHGTVGIVIKIDGNSLIVKSPDGVEKTVVITPDTTIRRGSAIIKVPEIVPDTQIVVIGTPKDNGTIEAKFIRIFDPTAGSPPNRGPFRFPLPKF
jgi:hypothetical protein